MGKLKLKLISISCKKNIVSYYFLEVNDEFVLFLAYVIFVIYLQYLLICLYIILFTVGMFTCNE